MAWSGQILRIDLSNRKYWTEDTEPYKRLFIGGKGINVKIMYDEVGPEVGPFDEQNRLCLGPGVLAGTLAPTHSRMKITGVSPHGLMNNSGLGGYVPAAIRVAGYDNVIIQGKSEKPVYIFIDDSRVEFREAAPIWGLDTQTTQQAIKSELGPSVKVCCVGPAGEKLVNFGCIVSGKGHAAGRGGFGAVMGSKNLKAIAVRGSGRPKYPNLEKFASYCKDMHKWVPNSCYFFDLQHKQGNGCKYTLGFSFFRQGHALGNWADYGIWDEAGEEKGPEEFYDECATEPQYGCYGCPAHHFHIFNIPNRVVGTTKCTQWSCFTGGVWNKERRIIVHANTLCQNYGLDSTSTGNAVSFLMDMYYRGIISAKDTDGIPMKRGDEKAILTTVEKIGRQEGYGQLFNDGVLGAAKAIGQGAEDYAMVVNGQELEPFEYRIYKDWALCAAITDGSVSHSEPHITINWIVAKEAMEKLAEELYGSRKAAWPTGYEHKGLLVFAHENKKTAGDLTGACRWLWPWGVHSLEVPAKLFSLGTDQQTSEEDLMFAAQRVLTLERAWRARKGIRRDSLPHRLFETAVTDGRYKGERLDRDGFEKMLDDYYALRGWNEEGLPTEETFKKFGLQSEGKAFKKELGKELDKNG
ncbi:MAG: hypothetical protein JRJ59_08585 [Deltaproteobacteria bacterium]|nr:hypothetical protein [Deltaproteobacteria bacterium]